MFKSPLNKTLTTVVAAVVVGATGAPAMAKSTPGQTVLYPQQKDGEQVYCAKLEPLVGTRIPTKICQSRAEWAEDGLVIPEKGRAAETSKQKKTSEG